MCAPQGVDRCGEKVGGEDVRGYVLFVDLEQHY